MKIHIIGDSHVRLFDDTVIKSYWTAYMSVDNAYLISHNATNNRPLSIYRLVHEGLDLNYMYGALQVKPDNQIKEGDVVIFSFGYNDIARNVRIQQLKNRDPSEIIDDLSEKYVSFLNDFSQVHKVKTLPWFIFPPTNHVFTDGGFFRPQGTPENRLEWSRMMNKSVGDKRRCQGLPYWENEFDSFSRPDGFMDSNFTVDFVHIKAEYREQIVKIVLQFISKFF